LSHPAVNVEFYAGDVGSIGRREEGNRAGDFFGFTEALQRNFGQYIFGKFIHLSFGEAYPIEDGCFDWAGRDGIDPNAAFDEFSGKRTREGTERSLGGGVD